MSKRMLWTEKLFQLIPIGKESGSFASFIAVRLIRAVCLTSVFVLIGVPVFAFVGFENSASQLLLYAGLMAPLYFLSLLFLMFIVSGWFDKKWAWFFGWSSGILKLNEMEFGRFRDRIEKFVTSFFGCLIITVVFIVIGMIPSFEVILKEIGPVLNPTLLIVSLAFTNIFMMLLLGTLIWIVASMWIAFYVTLRKPLNLRLSPHTDEEFRPLAMWSLKVLFITFVLVAILAVFYSLGVLVSPDRKSVV